MDEPEFVPTIYVTAPGKCEVQNSENALDIVTPKTQRWGELYCAPFEELLLMKQKNQKCEKWAE